MGRVRATALQTIADSLAVAREFHVAVKLDDNRITSLGPAFLARRKTLGVFTELSLASCDLKSVGAGAILRELSLGNTSITALNLSQNELGDGPEGADQKKSAFDEEDESVEQREFDRLLSGAPRFLTHLAVALKKIDTLVRLDLWRCSIGESGASYVSQALAANPSLKSLDLRSNSLGDVGVKFLVEGLRLNSVLTELNLEENNIQSDGGVLLASLLYPRVSEMGDSIIHPKCVLRRLDLKFNNVGATGASAFSAALASPVCPLEHLGIGGNGLGTKGADYLRDALQPKQPSKVDRKQGLGYFWGSPRLERVALTADIPVGRLRRGELETVDWTNRRLPDQDLILLAGALAGTSSLTELRLSGNKFTPEGVKALAGALQPRPRGSTKASADKDKRFGVHELKAAEEYSDPTLTESEKRGDPLAWPPLKILDLRNNHVRGGGVIPLREYLETAGSHALKELLLGRNGLRNRGAQELAKALKKGIRLEYSSATPHWRPYAMLDSNHSRQWIAFKEHGGCAQLTHLDISDNNIEDEGAIELAEAFALSDADVPLTEAAGESYKLFGTSVSFARVPVGISLSRIDLSSNELSFDGVEIIVEALAARRDLFQRVTHFVEGGGHWLPSPALCVYHLMKNSTALAFHDAEVCAGLVGLPSEVFSTRILQQMYLRERLYYLKEERWRMVESVEEVSFEKIDAEIKEAQDALDTQYFEREEKTEESLMLQKGPTSGDGDEHDRRERTIAVVRHSVETAMDLPSLTKPHTVVDVRNCARMRANTDLGGRDEVWKAMELARNEVKVSNWLHASEDSTAKDDVLLFNGFYGSGKGARKFYDTFASGGCGRGLKLRIRKGGAGTGNGTEEIADAVAIASLQKSKSSKNDMLGSSRFGEIIL